MQPGLERRRHLERQRLVGLAEQLAPLGVPEHDAVDVDLGQHLRRHLAGERALVGLVHRLREDLHARAARGVDQRLQREERRADRDVDAVGGRDLRQQRLDELLGLGDRLVHLPVAGDERRAAHDSASTPGRALPSISSSDAPPPVERWSTRSASPNSASAAAESPPPTTVVPFAFGHGLRYPARARRERLELERAHRAVPEHRAGLARSPTRRPRRSRARCRAPSSRRGRRRRRARAPRCRRRTRGPRRGPRAAAACRRRLERALRGLDALRPRTSSRRRRGPGRRRTGSTWRRRSAPSRRARGTRRARRSCRSPWRRRRPPRAGASGSSRIFVSVATSRSSSRPAADGSRCATASVEACARCAAPNASLT